jgi:hypothetical protein
LSLLSFLGKKHQNQKAPPGLQPAGAFRFAQNISASQAAGQRGNNYADDNGRW